MQSKLRRNNKTEKRLSMEMATINSQQWQIFKCIENFNLIVGQPYFVLTSVTATKRKSPTLPILYDTSNMNLLLLQHIGETYSFVLSMLKKHMKRMAGHRPL